MAEERSEVPAWRFWVVIGGAVALVGGGYWYSQRPTYDDLLTAEAMASAGLLRCQENALADCARERAAVEKAHQRVLDATP